MVKVMARMASTKVVHKWGLWPHKVVHEVGFMVGSPGCGLVCE